MWRHQKTVLQYSVKLVASTLPECLISAEIVYSQLKEKLIPFGYNIPDQIIQVRYNKRKYYVWKTITWFKNVHHNLTGNFSCRALFVNPSRSLRGGGEGSCTFPTLCTVLLFNLRNTCAIPMKLRPREQSLVTNILKLLSIDKWLIFQDS